MEDRSPKGPDYFIMDTVPYTKGIDEATLLDARKEAEALTRIVCDQSKAPDVNVRCDAMMWLKVLNSQTMPAFHKLANTILKEFNPNRLSQNSESGGDRTLRVDEAEIVVTYFNGASMKEQKYHRH